MGTRSVSPGSSEVKADKVSHPSGGRNASRHRVSPDITGIVAATSMGCLKTSPSRGRI
jgi:hypothetical protein